MQVRSRMPHRPYPESDPNGILCMAAAMDIGIGATFRLLVAWIDSKGCKSHGSTWFKLHTYALTEIAFDEFELPHGATSDG